MARKFAANSTLPSSRARISVARSAPLKWTFGPNLLAKGISVSFDIKIALGFAIGTIALLGYAGIRNRRSGYERKREDTMLDILMASAQARAVLSGDGDKQDVPVKEDAPPPKQREQVQPSLSNALISLHQALGESCVVEEASVPVKNSPVTPTLQGE